MSFPFFFDPVTLYRDGRPHLIVDGGVLSNFPVWLFDSPDPIKRRTWGFRLHQGAGPRQPPYHEVPRPLWPIPLAKAIFASTTEAWDQRMSEATTVRTVSIPTGSVKTLDFDLGAGGPRLPLPLGLRDRARVLPRRARVHEQLRPAGLDALRLVRGSATGVLDV